MPRSRTGDLLRTSSRSKIAFLPAADVPWWCFFAPIAFGILMSIVLQMLTDYYVSTHRKPTQEVAGVSNAGPAPMIIEGLCAMAPSRPRS